MLNFRGSCHCAALTLCYCAFSTLAPAFTNATSARIVATNGVPRLLINDQPTPPLIFFFNTYLLDTGAANLAPQVQAAAAHGVHIYSLVLPWPWVWEGTTPDYSIGDAHLQPFISADPNALFLVRINVDPPWDWPGLASAPSTDFILFKDGPSQSVSAASQFFHDHFITSLRALIQHYEASPYGPRIIGYDIAGQHEGVWFAEQYRERGPDLSAANQARFRQWLTAKYVNDAALSAAWGRAVTLATATIPATLLDRFPLQSGTEPVLDSFYHLPEERDWVDFSEYQATMFCQDILDYAAVVKEETGGRKLVAAANGYILELATSISGHWKASAMLLDSPNIDLFFGPVSYLPLEARRGGGMAESMSAIDSYAARGKLWVNEDDLKTYLIAWDDRHPWNPPTADLNETINVLQRNLGNVLIHRAGTWWMDLLADGAFSEPALWNVMSDIGAPLYNGLYTYPTPYRPEVAVVLDERSRLYEKGDWDLSVNTHALLRNALATTGASVGYYYLEDLLAGRITGAKVYVFPNLWYADASLAANIRSRLVAEHPQRVIWQYAPGLIGTSGLDPDGTEALTGIHVRVVDGVMGSEGFGTVWGWNTGIPVSPRVVIDDPAAIVIGRYLSDGLSSAAGKAVDNYTSILLADFPVPAYPVNTLPLLLGRDGGSGIHSWSEDGDVVRTDGELLVFHAATTGTHEVKIPVPLGLLPLAGGKMLRQGDSSLTLNQGDTRWYQIVSLPPDPPPTGVLPDGATVELCQSCGLAWDYAWGATSYDVYFGTAPDPPFFASTSQFRVSIPRLRPRTTYYWRVVAKNAFGNAFSPIRFFITGYAPKVHVGTFLDGLWSMDLNGDGLLQLPGERFECWQRAAYRPVLGNWNGGLYTIRTGDYLNGIWRMDRYGDLYGDRFRLPDTYAAWGWSTSTPVVGDWNGDGRDKIGVYDSGNWYLDYNGNLYWDPGVDKAFGWGSPEWTDAVPLIGDWNGDGRTEVGIFRAGIWYLDYNGNGAFDPGVDKIFGWGDAGSIPVVGDWNNDGKTEIGVFKAGIWYRDMNGNFAWDPGIDNVFAWGSAASTPIVGDWNGDGTDKIGAYEQGCWYLDYNGNGIWDDGIDKAFSYGVQVGEQPVVGRWEP